MGEQVIKKDVLGQTKEWMAVCFDKLCKKCNQETSQHQRFEHNNMDIDQQRVERFQAKEDTAVK